MKCPKCGFTSFDFLENCKKCGQDLQTHKSKFGLRSLIFPNLGGDSAPTEELGDTGEAPAAAAGEGLDFGFDFMSEEEGAAETAKAEAVATEETPAEETADEGFSFDAEEETDDSFEFSPEAEEDSSGFDFSEEEETSDDFDFSEEEAVEVSDETDSEDEFAFAETDQELDGGQAGDDLDFGDGTEEIDELGDWDEPAEATDVEDAEKTKPSAETEDPSDPFDLRGPAEFEQAPGKTLPEHQVNSSESVEVASLLETQDEFIPETKPATEADEPAEPFATEAEELPQQALFGFQSEETADAPDEFEHADIFAAAEEQADEITPATGPPLVPRLAAGICDLLILAIVFLLFLAAGELTLAEAERNGLLPGMETLLELSGPYFLVFFALCFGYFTLFHFLTGQTPGKMLFGLRVEDLAGNPLNFSQAFLRSVGGLFSLLPAGLGYLAILFSNSRRGWNDLLAGSHLVLISEQGKERFEELGEEDY